MLGIACLRYFVYRPLLRRKSTSRWTMRAMRYSIRPWFWLQLYRTCRAMVMSGLKRRRLPPGWRGLLRPMGLEQDIAPRMIVWFRRLRCRVHLRHFLKMARRSGSGWRFMNARRSGCSILSWHRDKRGRGNGRRLTNALLQWGRQMGAQNAYLQVRAQNEGAQNLYAGIGFQEVYRYHYRVPKSVLA